MSKTKWDQHSILAELRRKGMTLGKLAEMNGLNPGSFRHVWKRTHRKAEAAIADFLGIDAEELFPTRYPIRSASVLSSKYDTPAASQKSPSGAGMRSAA